MADAKEDGEGKEDVEEKISLAIRARLKDFRKQADSLTLVGIRRVIEKDMGMNPLSLDVHKRFIKQCLEQFLYGDENESLSKPSGTISQEHLQQESNFTSLKNEEINLPGGSKSDLPDLDEKPKGTASSEHLKNNGSNVSSASQLDEAAIRKAIKLKAAYFRANAETITLAGVRRLLENDLKLEKNTLDAFKSFISRELDKVLLSPDVVESKNGTKTKTAQSSVLPKAKKGSKRSKDVDLSSSNVSQSEEIDDDDELSRPKKKMAGNKKPKSDDDVRKRKTKNENKSSSPRKKSVEGGKSNDSGINDEKTSEDGHSHSSAEEDVKKTRIKPTQAYGKHVEHLKSVIRSCGMSVPPSVYKRAKQAPESKRENFLINELEDILEREGLSANPSEKEIKAVKRKKDRAKELEGIDTSNIVTTSRRRTTSSYLPPPKPKVETESEDEDEDGKDGEKEEDEEEADDGGNDAGENSNGTSDEDNNEESD